MASIRLGDGTLVASRHSSASGSMSTAGDGSYFQGDLLRVGLEAGIVRYLRNGSALYTSTAAPVFPLVVGTWPYTTGATLTAVVVSGSPP